MLKRRKMFIGVASGIALLMFVGGASAVMTAEELEAKKAEKDLKTTAIQADREAKKDEIESKKLDRAENRCEQIKERTRSRVEKFEGNNKYHQKNFNLIKENITEIVALFKTEGINTSDLESHLLILQTKLEKLYADHDAFIIALQASVNTDCANIETEIKNKFQIAKQEGQDIKADIIDIKNYYKETIRPELIDLKQEYLEKVGEDLDDEEDDEETN